MLQGASSLDATGCSFGVFMGCYAVLKQCYGALVDWML